MIETDMVVLGCVRSVKTLSLDVELPCFTNGVVLIKSISDEFTNKLNKSIDAEAYVEDVSNLYRLV